MAEPLSLREIQLEELAILKKLTDFYAEHGIRYILCGGTMLGAVRHNGFIPWDDDIDMLVPRDDYEKLNLFLFLLFFFLTFFVFLLFLFFPFLCFFLILLLSFLEFFFFLHFFSLFHLI